MGKTAEGEGVVGWVGQDFSFTSLKGRVYRMIWEPYVQESTIGRS